MSSDAETLMRWAARVATLDETPTDVPAHILRAAADVVAAAREHVARWRIHQFSDQVVEAFGKLEAELAKLDLEVVGCGGAEDWLVVSEVQGLYPVAGSTVRKWAAAGLVESRRRGPKIIEVRRGSLLKVILNPPRAKGGSRRAEKPATAPEGQEAGETSAGLLGRSLGDLVAAAEPWPGATRQEAGIVWGLGIPWGQTTRRIQDDVVHGMAALGTKTLCGVDLREPWQWTVAPVDCDGCLLALTVEQDGDSPAGVEP